jgi:YVTN family beta-propeller protein
MALKRAVACVAALAFGWAGVPAHAYTVYVSNEKGNSLTVIDSETLQVLTTIPVGQRPRGIMLSRDDKTVLICASDSNTVQVLDVATRNPRRAPFWSGSRTP